jgi:hypothetical protein
MRTAASLFLTCLFLTAALVWQAGCNPDVGLDDPLRPKADLQIVGFSPVFLQPTEVPTGGSVTSRTETTVTSRPETRLVVANTTVKARVNNGVSTLITSYSVAYTFQRSGNPSTGLALYGGPLNVFIDAAPMPTTIKTDTGGGEAASGDTVAPTEFAIDVLSEEAEGMLANNPNLLIANITFFCEDVNGHRFIVPAAMTLSSEALVSGQ